ncbi:hypothetical protein HDV64DRAFT_281646 [Trichoderma sp. TUCIM 5745]
MNQPNSSPLEDGSANTESPDTSAESQNEEYQRLSPTLKVIKDFSTICLEWRALRLTKAPVLGLGLTEAGAFMGAIPEEI